MNGLFKYEQNARMALAPSDPVLELKDVSRDFPGRTPGARPFTAVIELSFTVEQGEFVTIVGPSGCGKSTLLNLVAGLDRPSLGRVTLHGIEVSGPNPSVGFMLQKDLLLPWRTVLHNVEFGLEARALSAAERRERALRELKRCRLTEFADRYPYQISGGQRQRAALARTLAINPDIVLLDEPFSALDAQTKLILQQSFAATIAGSGLTTLLITHDLSEAVAMSDRILVMSDRPGRIVEEIEVGLSDRDNPMARVATPRASELVAHLFHSLHIDARVDA
ncbi:MAG TPA: ABC transporter ATP-binding protein [Xanthobacteraceae bacterium]|nr:ABC transporter ATP-binding protein [Xanthobacteraceae bacterium]